MNTRKYTVTKIPFIAVIVLFAASCVSFSESNKVSGDNYSPIQHGLTSTQLKLISSAMDSLEKPYSQTLKFGSKTFNNDCSGLIYGIFWEAGVDLIAETSRETGNGVKRVHSYLDKKGLIHMKKLPNPGDLVFWSNTYGKWGKNPLSHIGIIVSVDSRTGSIEYVHNNTYLGKIRKETMNLFYPHETRPVNNYMRYDNKYKKTAGELFDSFGMAWKL